MKNRIYKIVDKLVFWKKLPTDEEITKANLEEHKSEVFNRARKYTYPLQLSRKRIIWVSSLIGTLLILAFFGLNAFAIYNLNSDSGFIYQVSKLVPYPAARVNNAFVSYEEYLFELRILKHNHETRGTTNGNANIDLNSEDGKVVLQTYQITAFSKAQSNVLAYQLAAENNVSVSKEEVNQRVEQDKATYGGERRLAQFLADSFGWSQRDALNNWRRVLELSILKLKLTPILDKDSYSSITRAKTELDEGKDFASVARKYSQDTDSSEDGGDIGFKSIGDLPEEVEEIVFELEVGQYTDVIQTREGYFILKVTDRDEDEIRVSQIIVSFLDVDDIILSALDEAQTSNYIGIKPPEIDDHSAEEEQSQ